MSTFGALNTAYRGLTAAQQGMNVAGQNIANAATEGYTRQRVEQSSIAAPAQGLFGSEQTLPGQGVSVDGIARLGSGILDASVRTAGSQAGFASARSTALQGIEAVLQEPGETGLSTSLNKFWSAWQAVANQPGESAPAELLLQSANSVTNKISSAYQSLDTHWTSVREQTTASTNILNDAASRVAAYNGTIRSTVAAGGSPNELIDARAKLIENIARLAGGSVREQPDGTVDVIIGGNALVTGTTSRAVSISGGSSMTDATSVRLEWTDRTGSPIGLNGGTIGGALSVLAPSAAGVTGGAIAEAANAFNELAAQLANDVNAVHSQGQKTDGTAAGAFFFLDPSRPAALGIVSIQDPSLIAASHSGAGRRDGGNADAIAQIGIKATSPDATWAKIVTTVGVQSRGAQQNEALTGSAEISALNARASSASVSLDEENISLLTNQHAYQAAARVMTAIDEALDILINRTGLVGR